MIPSLRIFEQRTGLLFDECPEARSCATPSVPRAPTLFLAAKEAIADLAPCALRHNVTA